MSDNSQPAVPTTSPTTGRITKILRDIYATGRASVTIAFRPDFEITLGDKYDEKEDGDGIEESEGSSIDQDKSNELKKALEMLAHECEHESGESGKKTNMNESEEGIDRINEPYRSIDRESDGAESDKGSVREDDDASVETIIEDNYKGNNEARQSIGPVPVSSSNTHEFPDGHTKEHITPSTCIDYTSPIKEDPLITNMPHLPHCTSADLNTIEQTQGESSQPNTDSETADNIDAILAALTDLSLSIINAPTLATVGHAAVEEQTIATHAEQVPETNVDGKCIIEESRTNEKSMMIANTKATKHRESVPSQGLESACEQPNTINSGHVLDVFGRPNIMDIIATGHTLGPQYQQPMMVITTEDDTATTDTEKESIEGTKLMVEPTDVTEISSINSASLSLEKLPSKSAASSPSKKVTKASSAPSIQTLDEWTLAASREGITESQMDGNETTTPSDGLNTLDVKPTPEYIPTTLAESSIPQTAQQQEQDSNPKSRRSVPRFSATTTPSLSFLTPTQKSVIALLLADTLQSRAIRPYFDLDCLTDPEYVKLSLGHEFRRMRDRHRSRRQRLRSAFRFGGIAVYLRRYRDLLAPSEQRQLLKTSWKELKVQRRFGMRVFELFEVFGEQAFGKVRGNSIDFLGDLTQGQYRELRFYVRGVEIEGEKE
ncbi:483_t:CDS:2 [Paraglomus brasilianum]|uniref:483_t:CDS:1 n=1 Tax=Paraglomus brasilianum TaxID=144538 RepID=A0A9N8ZPN7_9GLOM|nr:483_t:CDS:2 [Paraglomus brasilianum]